ncbi:MAG: SDR family oxidoreductase [Actinomycetota bacterium]
MPAPMRIAVAGATGRVGHHVVDVLEADGHDVVAISRSQGVDVVTGAGLPEALAGVESVIDVATGSSPDQVAATEFFATAARNLHEAGERAGVRRMVVVSIIGCDRFTGGYGAAKVAHEKAHLAGPIPARVLRAAQFHEFVAQLVEWGQQDGVSYVPTMRTQLVAARTVAHALAEMATHRTPAPAPKSTEASFPEIAGPREESLVDMATLLVARRKDPVRIEEVSDPDNGDLYESDALLPGPDATLAGPTFEAWLDAEGA